jgi:hypothetical protein
MKLGFICSEQRIIKTVNFRDESVSKEAKMISLTIKITVDHCILSILEI